MVASFVERRGAVDLVAAEIPATGRLKRMGSPRNARAAVRRIEC